MGIKTVGNFKALKDAFLQKNFNGSIEKIAGGVKVVFDTTKGNNEYTYRGTLGVIAQKLKIEVNTTNNIKIKEKVKTDGVVRGGMYVDNAVFGIYPTYGTTYIEYTINSGMFFYEFGTSSDLKIYESKKGNYINVNNKRVYIKNEERKGETQEIKENENLKNDKEDEIQEILNTLEKCINFKVCKYYKKLEFRTKNNVKNIVYIDHFGYNNSNLEIKYYQEDVPESSKTFYNLESAIDFFKEL